MIRRAVSTVCSVITPSASSSSASIVRTFTRSSNKPFTKSPSSLVTRTRTPIVAAATATSTSSSSTPALHLLLTRSVKTKSIEVESESDTKNMSDTGEIPITGRGAKSKTGASTSSGGTTSGEGKLAGTERGGGGTGQELQQVQGGGGGGGGGQGQWLTSYDPWTMRLGMGDWNDWGLMTPSLLDQPFSSLISPFGGFPSASALLGDMVRVPTMDLQETPTNYELTTNLPGVPKDNVKVDLTGRTLTVSAERKQETTGERGAYSKSYGRFTRSLVLPRDSDADKIQAKLEHGQLKLHIPKRPGAHHESRPIRIE